MEHYDLAVIGGGSGGMAAAKAAGALGKRVAMFDFVKESPHGSSWGVGGTCVNVGCIPKKLMHYAALMGPVLHHDAEAFGWQTNGPVTHSWTQLVDNVQMFIRKLNFNYKKGLRGKVQYINALASLVDNRTLSYTLKGETKQLTAEHIILAPGGRPSVPQIPGHELAVTSDDLFSLRTPPRKCLVVGAAYIALECAGFLTHLGVDTTVVVRSVPLRGFDRQCADKVVSIMTEMGTKFSHSLPSAMSKVPEGVQVSFQDGSLAVYDTVMYATGRHADVAGLNLSAAGVELTERGKIKTDAHDCTTQPNIFSIGDASSRSLELTPVAIKTGELLVRRLYEGSSKLMEMDSIPTTVFTPVEYAHVGLSEEEAQAQYPEDVDCYLFEFTTLEHQMSHREKVPATREHEFDVDMSATCLCKVVVRKDAFETVLGMHFIGPNAGELMQGFGVAFRKGLNKSDLDDTVGIHPTDAEAFCGLSVTKSSGESWLAAGGCGGGKCG
ncbi:MAG: hypothetical protein KVP17_002805 [Porospora cf. gigantea B]|uniref:uncharacterized protein n=1 Tax=Porospora cf. gigantea B TaxID=2853592 RepID=UPI003571DB60|nr:MAG: hypothetical protein KVP17_002805 [Porospora cf. gigantea B]